MLVFVGDCDEYVPPFIVALDMFFANSFVNVTFNENGRLETFDMFCAPFDTANVPVVVLIYPSFAAVTVAFARALMYATPLLYVTLPELDAIFTFTALLPP